MRSRKKGRFFRLRIIRKSRKNKHRVEFLSPEVFHPDRQSAIIVVWGVFFGRKVKVSNSSRACSQWMVMVLLSSLLSGTALAIVLHPGEGEPNLVEWTDRPHDDLIGRWGNNASCVVVSPNCVVTTRHQGGGIGTGVHIAGLLYRVEEVWNYPDNTNPDDDDYGAVDLRIAKLTAARLKNYVGLFTGQDADLLDADIVIGGYGLGRGAQLNTSGMTYGYAWQDASLYGNRYLRWCTNRIDFTRDNVTVLKDNGELDNNQDCVVADFDDPWTTRYEGAVAGFDSGCGWFTRTDEQWQLAGLAWGVEHAEDHQTWFRSPDDPNVPHPDEMYALRMNSYADWVQSTLDTICSDPPRGDINGDCSVNLADVRQLAAKWLSQGCRQSNLFCAQSDINGDGNVNLEDLAEIQQHYHHTEH